jgi:hypothetical protein
MRKKGGQLLMELSRRKPPPVIEETVERFTDSDRFEQPILHDVGPIEEELPPAPVRQDFIGKMFPRLSAAVDLFDQIDVSRFRQARGEAGRMKFDEAAGEALLDSVLVNQLSDLENRLSLENPPKNLPQVKRRLDKQHLGGVLTPIDEESASQAILKRLQANRTKALSPSMRKAEKKAVFELASGLAAGAPVLGFNDIELESLLPKFGLEMPSGDDITIMEQLVAAYEEASGFPRTVLQAWVVIHHPEMDQEFFDWIPTGPEEN